MSRIIKILFAYALFLISTSTFSQSKYCTTLQDYSSGNWTLLSSGFDLEPTSGNPLIRMPKSTDKAERKEVRKHALVVEYSDTLYISLKQLEAFGEGFTRAWKMSDGCLLFARNDISPRGGIGIGIGGSGVVIPFGGLKSKKKLENLVCYIVSENARNGSPNWTKVTVRMMDDLLHDHPDVSAKYAEYESKRQDDADVVIEMLSEAGVIE